MESIYKFKRTITWIILVTAAVVAVAALVMGEKAGAKGFVLGSLFSLLNFVLMVRLSAGRLSADRKKATLSSFLGLVFRLGLMAIPLLVALYRPEIDVIWTAVGLFNLQFSIMFYGFIAARFQAAGEPTIQGR